MEDDAFENAKTHTQAFCSKCGGKLAIFSQFCSGCGAQVGAEPVIASNTDEVEASFTAMNIGSAWAIYFCALFFLALLAKIIPEIIFPIYIIIGVYMSRSMMRRLIEWHPNYNTLYNVTSAKLQMVGFWPISMFTLLFRLTINKVL